MYKLQDATPRTLTRGQARLLAFTAGATVANLYYAQPLLPTIADQPARLADQRVACWSR